MPGMYMVHIEEGSRYRKGKIIPISDRLLQPHKVHKLQIQSVMGPLPDHDADQFPLFTDKPDKYPDLSHHFTEPEPEEAPHDEPERDQLVQARNALGLDRQEDPYTRAKEFIRGNNPVRRTTPDNNTQGRDDDPFTPGKKRGTLGV